MQVIVEEKTMNFSVLHIYIFCSVKYLPLAKKLFAIIAIEAWDISPGTGRTDLSKLC